MTGEEKEIIVKEFIKTFFSDEKELKFLDEFYVYLQRDFMYVTNSFKDAMTEKFKKDLIPQGITFSEVMNELLWQLSSYKVEAINSHLQMLKESIQVSESIQPVLGTTQLIN